MGNFQSHAQPANSIKWYSSFRQRRGLASIEFDKYFCHLHLVFASLVPRMHAEPYLAQWAVVRTQLAEARLLLIPGKSSTKSKGCKDRHVDGRFCRNRLLAALFGQYQVAFLGFHLKRSHNLLRSLSILLVLSLSLSLDYSLLIWRWSA